MKPNSKLPLEISWKWRSVFLILFLAALKGNMGAFMCDPISSSVQLTPSQDYYLSTVSNDKVSLAGPQNCTLQIIHSASTFLRIEVMHFNLGGIDPCGINDERLEILFYYYYPKIVSTVIWCGQSYGPVLETRHNVTLVYYPSSSGRLGNFDIKFSLVQKFCQSGVSSLQVGIQSIYVYSPGYPGPYTDYTECRWNLTTVSGQPISLDTYSFDLEYHAACSFDYLKFDGASYCGNQRVRKTSRSGRVAMEFVTDHLQTYNGFVIRLVEISGQHPECGTRVVLSSGPNILNLPALRQGIFDDVQCWWLLDAGSDSHVVLLDISSYYTRASCMDFQTIVYDGVNDSAPLLSSGCAPQQTFQTIRSSGRYVYIDVSMEGFGYNPVNVTYMATASWKNSPPRLLYAGLASSYVWLDMATFLSTWLLLRIDRDADNDYSQCLHLSLVDNPYTPQAYDLSCLVYAYSGPDRSFMELGAGCGRSNSKHIVSRGTKVLLIPKPSCSSVISSVWLVYNLSSSCTPDVIPLQSSDKPAYLRSDVVEYGSGYPNNAYCRWVIKPSSSYLSTQVRVDDSLLTSSCEDNMTAFDYKSDFEYNKIMDWCGSEKPTLVSSLGNSILLDFLTNASGTDKGFSLTYSSIALQNACPTLTYLVVNMTWQYLTSPNFPYNYPSSGHGKGNKTIVQQTIYTVRYGKMQIAIGTENSCPLFALDSVAAHLSNVDCKWLVTAVTGVVQLELLNLSIYYTPSFLCSGGDFLAVYDGPDDNGPVIAELCSSTMQDAVYTSSSDSMLLHFHSDNMFSAQGFHLRLASSQNVGYNCNKDIYVNDSAYVYISSPHYPEPYPKGVDCWWRVLAPQGQVIRLEVIDVDIPGCEDSAVVYDGESTTSPRLHQICDDSDRVTVVSTWQYMYVAFASQTHGKYRGFNLQLSSASESLRCDGRVIPVTASPSVTYITSPNYPRSYPPNIVCQWRVESTSYNQTIMLEVLDAVLESSYSCSFDNVIIYDGYNEDSPVLGKFCGRTTGSYWSKSGFMFVKFHSDSNGQSRGFKLAVQSVSGVPPAGPNGASSSDGNTSNIGAIAGTVTGAFLFLLLCVTALLCFLGRHRRTQSSGLQSQPARRRARAEQGNTVFVMSPVIFNQMAPPPYPGVVNTAYVHDDMPPSYNSAFICPPPPSYSQIDTLPPPPYTEDLRILHPPSRLSNRGSTVRCDAAAVEENGGSGTSREDPHARTDFSRVNPSTRLPSVREEESVQQSQQILNYKNILSGRHRHLEQASQPGQVASREDFLGAIRQNLVSASRHGKPQTRDYLLNSPNAQSSSHAQLSPDCITQTVPHIQGVLTSDTQNLPRVQGYRSHMDQQLTSSGQARSIGNGETVLHRVPSVGQGSQVNEDQHTQSQKSGGGVKETFV